MGTIRAAASNGAVCRAEQSQAVGGGREGVITRIAHVWMVKLKEDVCKNVCVCAASCQRIQLSVLPAGKNFIASSASWPTIYIYTTLWKEKVMPTKKILIHHY